MLDTETIETFIKNRFMTDCHWLDGNCLYFAYILKIRFPELEIYYLPIQGHFVAGVLGQFWDWGGEVVLEETPIPLEEIRKNDKNWYNRIMMGSLYGTY